MEKKTARIRRTKRTRAKIRSLGANRLSVFRTPRHIYAQILDSTGSKVIASASTLDEQVKGEIKYSGNCNAETTVGKVIAERAKSAGISKVAFDRSGFKYHGRIKALADAARESGLEF